MKPYPKSVSPAAAPAAWTAYIPGQPVVTGTTRLSTTHPRRALRRLLAHVEREIPKATYVCAEFVPFLNGELVVEGTDTDAALSARRVA